MMKKEILIIAEIKLIGLKIRTNNKNESNPLTSKIASLVMNQYYGFGTANKIPSRKNPGITFGIYTEYESDYTGDYTYFIGEEVTSFEQVPDGLSSQNIIPGTYAQFTTEIGAMPQIIIKAWNKIWQMTESDLTGNRSYQTDFEIYNPSNQISDPTRTTAEIYIGIGRD